MIERLARRGKGLPARVIPVEIEHMASTGLDVWLGALAYGATGLAVLATGAEAPQYRAAIERQMDFADIIAQALGYQGRHFTLLAAADVAALEQGVWSLEPALAVRVPALFRWTDDKRTTIRMAVEHLLAHAPTPVSTIALPAGAPFGAIDVNRETCTLCLACVGACPEGAILDHAQSEIPQLRFIETQCVQCGLVRRHLSRGCDPARAAPVAGARGEAAACAQRGRDFQLHALRQAAGHRKNDRQHAGEAGGTFDVRRAGVARPAQDVRRLPRDRHDGKGAGPAPLAPARRQRMQVQLRSCLPNTWRPEDQARADFYALLSRLFAQAPDAALLATIAAAPPLSEA